MSPTTFPRNICIVGNIGSGKSTLTKLLEKAIPNSIQIPEDFRQNPFLKLYVQNPPRWAFENAVRYFYDYARVYQELTAGRGYDYAFIDAGGATNRYVYGRYLVAENVMTAAENAFYNVLADMIQREFSYPEPDAYIFLDSTPKACFARMKKRGWTYQTRNIRLHYLVALQRYFYAFRVLVQERGIPTLVLDRESLNFKSVSGRAKTLELVNSFLQTQVLAL
jgi:deoxyadenosine/deoxycytidine kinase